MIREHGAPGSFELIENILTESPDVVFKHIYYKWEVITADPDDNKFFDISVSCNADYLVTNDNHFNVVKNLEFPKVNVCNIETFLEIVMKMT